MNQNSQTDIIELYIRLTGLYMVDSEELAKGSALFNNQENISKAGVVFNALERAINPNDLETDLGKKIATKLKDYLENTAQVMNELPEILLISPEQAVKLAESKDMSLELLFSSMEKAHDLETQISELENYGTDEELKEVTNLFNRLLFQAQRIDSHFNRNSKNNTLKF